MFMWIFSLLWYLFLVSLLLIAALPVVVLVFLLKANDFPNRRKNCTSKIKLDGKTAIITGCNRGIGYETLKDFAVRGAKVYMACRSVERAETAKSKVIAETGNKDVHILQCDLLDLESVQNFCKQFLAKESTLHILVNNAGLAREEGLTKQKFDATVGANHVGHFLLTYLLMDTMKKSTPARIINVSSASNFDCHEVGLKKEENGVKLPQMKYYWCSKLLNVLHAKELARLLNGTGITSYSLHPGFIYDGMMTNRSEMEGVDRSSFNIQVFGRILKLFKFLSLTSEQGAQTTIYCSVDESIANESGKYYDNCTEKMPNKLALDGDLSRRLWKVTLELVQDYTKVAAE